MKNILTFFLATSTALVCTKSTENSCIQTTSAVITNPSLATLKNHLKSDKLIIIDVQASWCSACKTFKPVLEKVAADKNDRVVYIIIDYDQAALINHLLPSTDTIKAIPSVFFFKDNKVVEKFVGSKNETQLRALIKQHQD